MEDQQMRATCLPTVLTLAMAIAGVSRAAEVAPATGPAATAPVMTVPKELLAAPPVIVPMDPQQLLTEWTDRLRLTEAQQKEAEKILREVAQQHEAFVKDNREALEKLDKELAAAREERLKNLRDPQVRERFWATVKAQQALAAKDPARGVGAKMKALVGEKQWKSAQEAGVSDMMIQSLRSQLEQSVKPPKVEDLMEPYTGAETKLTQEQQAAIRELAEKTVEKIKELARTKAETVKGSTEAIDALQKRVDAGETIERKEWMEALNRQNRKLEEFQQVRMDFHLAAGKHLPQRLGEKPPARGIDRGGNLP